MNHHLLPSSFARRERTAGIGTPLCLLLLFISASIVLYFVYQLGLRNGHHSLPPEVSLGAAAKSILKQAVQAPNKVNLDYGVIITENGQPLPLNKQGQPMVQCRPPVADSMNPFVGSKDAKVCKFFKEGITVTEVDQFTLIRQKFTSSPECSVYIFWYAGMQYYYYDPTDPNCSHL